jgi:hypothetical protein
MRPLSEISTNLDLGPDGAWTTRAVSPVSYPETGNDFCFAIEDASFWFRHRNQCILRAVRLLPPSGPIFPVRYRRLPGAVERARADREVSSPTANRVLEFPTARERRRLRHRRVSRFGGSCLVVGRKPLQP